MDQTVIAAVIALFTGILGSEVVKRILTASQDRESAAQAAIIELAREALAGWRAEGRSVQAMAQSLRDHNETLGHYYEDLKQRSERQGKRLDKIDTTLMALHGQDTN